MCQNSPLIEITLAATTCGEGDFSFMRVSTHFFDSYGMAFIA